MPTGRKLNMTLTRDFPWHDRIKKASKKLVTRLVRRRMKVQDKKEI